MTTASPIREFLNNPDYMKEIFPDHPRLTKQITERIRIHSIIAIIFNKIKDPRTTISAALENGEVTVEDVDLLYSNLTTILKGPYLGSSDNHYLALYLPFEILPDPTLTRSTAINSFINHYRTAWRYLLAKEDVRANFVDGDVLELAARASDPQPVVKAAHISPWLVRAGIVPFDDIVYNTQHSDNLVLRHSFADTLSLYTDLNLVSKKSLDYFTRIIRSLPPLPEQKDPIYISPERLGWLLSRDKEEKIIRPSANTPFDQLPDLAAPFSSRISELTPEIERVKQAFAENSWLLDYFHPIALLGGSRIKGYSTANSDTDLYLIAKKPLENNPLSLVRDAGITNAFLGFSLNTLNPNDNLSDEDIHFARVQKIHILFNSIPIGDPAFIQTFIKETLKEYLHCDAPTRLDCLDRLEFDALLYRLCHTGYARTHPQYNPEFARHAGIDGSSAFYDSGFRRIATLLFLSHVFLPKLN